MGVRWEEYCQQEADLWEEGRATSWALGVGQSDFSKNAGTTGAARGDFLKNTFCPTPFIPSKCSEYMGLFCRHQDLFLPPHLCISIPQWGATRQAAQHCTRLRDPSLTRICCQAKINPYLCVDCGTEQRSTSLVCSLEPCILCGSHRAALWLLQPIKGGNWSLQKACPKKVTERGLIL